MTPNEMTKTQVLVLVKVLRAFLSQYASHTDECDFRLQRGGCTCGYSISLAEVSDAIEGKTPAFTSRTTQTSPSA